MESTRTAECAFKSALTYFPGVRFIKRKSPMFNPLSSCLKGMKKFKQKGEYQIVD